MAQLTGQQIAESWARWLAARNRSGLRVGLWLVLVLYPLFAVLDYLVAPPHALTFLYATRGAVTAYTLALFAVRKTAFFERNATLLSATFTVVVGLGISAMLAVLSGLVSPYYAGLVLVMVGAGLVFVWSPRVVIVTDGLLVVSYILPNVFTVPEGQWTTAVSNVFFFVAIAVVLAVGQVVTSRTLFRQLVTRLTLERTTADLELAHQRLQEVDRYRTRFFANITHELRTPLTLILSPVDAILQGQVGDFSPEQAEYLRGIQRNGLKLLKLINDILDLVKLDESHLLLHVEPTDLTARLREIVGFVRPLAERKQLTITLEDGAGPADVWVDPEQFERVVVNLLSNAIKFTPEGGAVAVRLETAEQTVTVLVEDTGVGIPPDDLPRVFDRFTQVDDSLTRRYGGTGIGLALVREIVALHGGTIQAQSTLGAGTRIACAFRRGVRHFDPERVRFSSDAAADRGAVGGPGAGVAAASDSGGEVRGLSEWMQQIRSSESYRFLAIEQDTDRRVVRRDPGEQLKNRTAVVVDDNRDMLEFLQFQLHGRYRVYAATDGDKAWEVIKREKPHIVISDYMMPGMDGIELCARVKADPETRHTPFILLSAKAEVDDRVRGHESGADAYLAKPFRPRELHALLDRHIRAGEQLAEALLEKRMRSLDLLSAGLAHEIRNPLTYIKNGLYKLRDDVDEWRALAPGDEARREKLRQRMEDMFSVADKGVTRIAAVVELIKQYAQEGSSVVEREYPIDEAVRRTLPLLAPYRPKRHALHQDLQAPGVAVWIVPEQLHHVLTGLVQNALDAIPDGGNVWVSTRRTGGRVRLCVRDDGPGIPEQARRDIFSPFYSTKAPGEGMGLGLTIVHRVVTRAGGTIHIETEPGVGTEFTVELPVVPPDLRGAARPWPTA
jgi:signal transduction histidine kinase